MVNLKSAASNTLLSVLNMGIYSIIFISLVEMKGARQFCGFEFECIHGKMKNMIAKIPELTFKDEIDQKAKGLEIWSSSISKK